ncbi:amino acid transporter [Scopulibacillus daqui]|uniref:Amino acid transporter n=1 Tax=Scopulibacillus daqui TaxID=1469162 RepID=A0ABS2Q437_9BACL|nr:APC family permease [Scopulibacillus daqui]MBM7646252.1 amino acid transporter [Scopulibacillus daqui]
MPDSSNAKLKSNAINMFDNTVVGIASTAPAYSLAVSFGSLIVIVGFMSPAVLLINFLPILGIACAFYYMNKYYGPSAGGIYTWVGGGLNPHLGYMAGWAIIAADVLQLISGSIPVGTYTLDLFDPSLANDTLLVSLISAAWFVLVSLIVIRGIEITIKFQWVLLLIEYVALIVFAAIALYHAYALNVPGSSHISWSWFIFHGNFATFASATTIAVFFYWGVDSITNLGEESKDAATNPGWAGIWATVGLLVIFMIVALSIQALLPAKVIAEHQADILNYVATRLVPYPWNDIMILCVMSSTLATLETSLLPTARVTLEMARDKVFPKAFARVHNTWKTPWLGTAIIGLISLIGIFLLNLSSGVGHFLDSALNNAGIMVAYYYGITGIACAWYMRRNLRNWSTIILGFIFPLLSGMYLLIVGAEVLIESGFTSSLPALLSFVIGIPIMIYYAIKEKDWFKRPLKQLPRIDIKKFSEDPIEYQKEIEQMNPKPNV